MRAVTFTEQIPQGVLDRPLEPGVEYLILNRQAADFSRWRTSLDRFEREYANGTDEQKVKLEQLRPIAQGNAAIGSFTSRDATALLKPWKSPICLDKKKLLLIRAGGFGDMIMLMPLLKKIHSIWKKVRIGVSCIPRFSSILSAIPYLDQELYVPFPIKADDLKQFDYHVNYEDTIEWNPAAATMHGAEMFGKWVNLPIRAEDHAVEFEPGEHLMPDWLQKHRKYPNEKWVGIFVAASARQRCWPVDWSYHLMNALALEGYKVCPLGNPADLGAIGYLKQDGMGGQQLSHYVAAPPNILPSCGTFANIPQLADFMRRYLDLVITPDTIGVHLAGVMKIPCLAIYGPFPADTRVKYYPTVEAMQGNAECAPCLSHEAAMPCGFFWCKAMAEVLPHAVFARVKEICPRQQPRRDETLTLSPVAPQSCVRLHKAGGKPTLSIAR